MPRVVRQRKNAAYLGLPVLLVAILCAGPSKSHPGPQPKAVGQATQAGTGGWGGSDPKYLIFWGGPKQVPDLLARIRTTGDGKSTQLGFGLPFATFEQEKELPAAIHDAFQTAKKYNVAVILNFDDHFMWKNRPDLWNWFDPEKPGYNPANKENVEWSDWKGTPNKARYINHGSPVRLAPGMCFSSPILRKEVTRIVTTVIGPALKSELDGLKQEGKENLFAGVVVGQEPEIDDYTRTIDPGLYTYDPGVLQLMKKDGAPIVRLGYCALTHRGYSEKNPPADFNRALAEVNQEFLSFWCKQFVDAGIPSSRLYTHVAAPRPQTETNAPIWIAFNEYARPGWTTYPVMVLASDFHAIYDDLKKHGDPPWGGVEANDGFPGATSISWEGYLARHFNFGAKLVGINYGASSDKLTNQLWDSAFSTEALAAYKKFFSGEPLQMGPPQPPGGQGEGTPPAGLQQKMNQLHAAVEKWQEEGRDLSPVRQIMQDVHPLMQQRKFPEAEALVDRALKLLAGTTPQEQPRPQSQAGPPQSLQQKVQRMQTLIERRQQEGADMQPVGELLQDFDPLMQQQKFTEAEALVDRVLKLLGDSPTPASPAPAQQPGATSGSVPPSLQAKMARLQALAQKRQDEGFDMAPVAAVADGVQPLIDQQKYTEAEAQVDRALKLLGDSPTPATPGAAQQPGATPGGIPPSLQAKISHLQKLAQKRQDEGFDMEPVAAVADGVQPLIDQQKYTEAEAQVDRALKLLGDSPAPEAPARAQQPGATSGGVPPSLQAKMQRLHTLFERRKQEGADLQPVEEVMQDFDSLMQQQKFTEAEALVDRALKLLGESTPEGQGSPHDAKHP